MFASITVVAMVFGSVEAEVVLLFSVGDVSNDVVVVSPRCKELLYLSIQWWNNRGFANNK